MTHPGSYSEIPVTNLDRTIAFYQAAFDCKLEMENIDGNEMALLPATEGVPGITGALTKGQTYLPQTSLTPLGFVAEFEDSEGNRVALHQPATK